MLYCHSSLSQERVNRLLEVDQIPADGAFVNLALVCDFCLGCIRALDLEVHDVCLYVDVVMAHHIFKAVQELAIGVVPVFDALEPEEIDHGVVGVDGFHAFQRGCQRLDHVDDLLLLVDVRVFELEVHVVGKAVDEAVAPDGELRDGDVELERDVDKFPFLFVFEAEEGLFFLGERRKEGTDEDAVGLHPHEPKRHFLDVGRLQGKGLAEMDEFLEFAFLLGFFLQGFFENLFNEVVLELGFHLMHCVVRRLSTIFCKLLVCYLYAFLFIIILWEGERERVAVPLF